MKKTKKKTKLTILMPALNEEHGIGGVIDEIPIKELKKMGYSPQVVIIDGHSTDKTVKIAKKKGAIVHKCDRGYGRQYKHGFSIIKEGIIVTGDSDGTYPMGEIPSLLKIMERENLDFITTDRFVSMEHGSMSLRNYIGNRILSITTRVLFGVDVKDSQSGMWVINAKKLPKLNLTSDGMPLSEELKIEAFRKLRAKEVPSSYKRREGEVKLRAYHDGLRNLMFLFTKRFSK